MIAFQILQICCLAMVFLAFPILWVLGLFQILRTKVNVAQETEGNPLFWWPYSGKGLERTNREFNETFVNIDETQGWGKLANRAAMTMTFFAILGGLLFAAEFLVHKAFGWPYSNLLQ